MYSATLLIKTVFLFYVSFPSDASSHPVNDSNSKARCKFINKVRVLILRLLWVIECNYIMSIIGGNYETAAEPVSPEPFCGLMFVSVWFMGGVVD